MGPNTLPWGTTETTGDNEEAEPLTTTRWLRPVKKLDVSLVTNNVVGTLQEKPFMGDRVKSFCKV